MREREREVRFKCLGAGLGRIARKLRFTRSRLWLASILLRDSCRSALPADRRRDLRPFGAARESCLSAIWIVCRHVMRTTFLHSSPINACATAGPIRTVAARESIIAGPYSRRSVQMGKKNKALPSSRALNRAIRRYSRSVATDRRPAQTATMNAGWCQSRNPHPARGLHVTTRTNTTVVESIFLL